MKKYVLAAVMLSALSLVSGVDYFVSPQGKAAGRGTRQAPISLARANQVLNPGDTAFLTDGVYTGVPIAPENSGVEGRPIAYRAVNRHKVVLREIEARSESRGPAAVIVNNRAWIEIDGIKVAGIKRWLIGLKAHHISLLNNHFESSTGWINCRFEENGDGIRLKGNHFNEGTDLVSIDGGDHHLIEDNFFGDASHTGLVLLGVQRSVVRNNRLTNRRWRCMEVESQRHIPFRHSKYNLIEGNIFDYSPASGIQYAGNYSILRRNIFRHCLTGMNWANYVGSNKGSKKRSPEAWHNEHNRFYNNIISRCGRNATVLALIEEKRAAGFPVEERVAGIGYGMKYATNMFNPPLKDYPDCAYGDNIAVNNIFYRNGITGQQPDKKGPTAAPTIHVAFDWNATPEFGRLYNNVFFSDRFEADVFYYADAPYERPAEPRNRSIVSFEKRYPNWAAGNREADPRFADPEQGDFHLKTGSSCIDTGVFLAAAAHSGKGKLITLTDVLYFSDGHGLVKPDSIRVGPSKVIVVGVDYVQQTILVDRRISWKRGSPVTLEYRGQAPDLGVFETK